MDLPKNHRRGPLVWLAILLSVCIPLVGCADDVDWAAPDGTSADDNSAGEPGTTLDAAGYSATIRRTEGQVVHVEASDLANLAFGQGWASGEDRTCDLADQVLKVNSERARYFGPGKDNANVDSDFAWLTVGIAQLAAEDWKTVDAETRSLFEAYTAGWNGHLEKVGTENIDDWCAGAEWVRPLEPVEVYAYARSIALLASSGAVIDMIGTAQPPSPGPGGSDSPAAASDTDAAPDTNERALARLAAQRTQLGSNGWAIGEDRTESGAAQLLANPHFPWEGELRFWEVHLTIPGSVNMYGVQLSGVPGIGIGFNENFGWTHTVSAGYRMTAYTLDLVDGSPTTYRYGDGTRELEPTKFTIKVLGEDGKVTEQTRTTWRSHYGPVLDFPGVGWSNERAVTMRDANLDNDEFVTQYIQTLKADNLDDLIELNRRYTGVPLFNTIAASSDGRAWYADTAATPNLSAEAQDAYSASLKTDPLVGLAHASGAILLDGSNPLFEWQEAKGARDPGLVPFEEMPQVTRSDYVFNANDSFWMPNATHMIEGDYSILHGDQRTARSPRTRENATVLESTTKDGPAGDDHDFSFTELKTAALANRGFTSRALLDEVVERCSDSGPVAVEELSDPKLGTLPAGSVDISEACRILGDWDGVYDIDSRGPIIWREVMARYDDKDFLDRGPLWADPFDADDPVATPSGLAAAPEGVTDPVLVNLARAVQSLGIAKIPLDTPLGQVQTADRNGTPVAIHGGDGADGTTNIAAWNYSFSTMDPYLLSLEGTRVAPGASARRVTGEGLSVVGYPVDFGTSFLMALEFTKKGPRAGTFLTYGNLADRSAPSYLESTQRYSEKNWKTAIFDPKEVLRAALSTEKISS